MFVARFTVNPEADVKRGWSAWMGISEDTEEKALSLALDQATLSEEDRQVVDEWYDYDVEVLREIAENYNIDVRFDEAANQWRLFHHDGLSCWPLNAESLEEAIRESESRNLQWSGNGYSTQGSIKYAAATNIPNLHIFECDDCSAEVY